MYFGKTLSLQHGENATARLIFNRQNDHNNKFDNLAVDELSQALDALEAADNVAGLLVSSDKDVFMVGADITEFTGLFNQSSDFIRASVAKNNKNFRRIERLVFPVVVAINGLALGGGLEFCLACDRRVIASTATVGLPETGLGIIPGWGGSARLPRVAGVGAALEWIIFGRNQSARAALDAGVVDQIVDPAELLIRSQAVLNDCIEGVIDFRTTRDAMEKASAVLVLEAGALAAQWQDIVAKQFGARFPAQGFALQSVLAGIEKPLDEAIAEETRWFIRTIRTNQSRALVGNFLSEQYLMKCARNRAKSVANVVSRAGVLGAGIMGGGIAYQSALTGTPIIMKDITQEGLDLGMKEAGKLLSKGIEKGWMSDERKVSITDLITPVLEYGEEFGKIDLLVEAVVENSKIKSAVLKEVENRIRPDTVLCSNTSTLPISELAQSLSRPEQFCGMHFFNPVHAMPLVEIIRGQKTSEETINRTVAYALSLKKKPVVVNDCPGFLVNRLLFAYFAGFMQLIYDGADYEVVDRVMENWGWPMGPAYLADVVGLDTMQHCDDVLSTAYSSRFKKEFKSWYQIIIDLGGLGQKNGKGFYNYSVSNGRSLKEPNTVVKARIDELSKPVCKFAEEEIVERIMIGMAIEMAYALEEKIVASPQEGDIALIYGVGFPQFRGGLARWMDAVSMANFVKKADQYADDLGLLYRVTDRQREMARLGESYYS